MSIEVMPNEQKVERKNSNEKMSNEKWSIRTNRITFEWRMFANVTTYLTNPADGLFSFHRIVTGSNTYRILILKSETLILSFGTKQKDAVKYIYIHMYM
jgi:hypothetical protein